MKKIFAMVMMVAALSMAGCCGNAQKKAAAEEATCEQCESCCEEQQEGAEEAEAEAVEAEAEAPAEEVAE